MQPIYKEYGLKKPTYGHTFLFSYTRDEQGNHLYTYQCQCGRKWAIPSPKRDWHCGALDCPYLPKRKKQQFFPKPVGRPRTKLSGAAQALGMKSEIEGSQHPRACKMTFSLDPYLRARFEELRLLMRVSISDSLNEAVQDWCNRYSKAVYGKKVVTSASFLEDNEEHLWVKTAEEEARSEELRKIYYRGGKPMEELFAVESSHEPMRNGKPIFGDKQGSR